MMRHLVLRLWWLCGNADDCLRHTLEPHCARTLRFTTFAMMHSSDDKSIVFRFKRWVMRLLPARTAFNARLAAPLPAPPASISKSSACRSLLYFSRVWHTLANGGNAEEGSALFRQGMHNFYWKCFYKQWYKLRCFLFLYFHYILYFVLLFLYILS